MQRRQQQRGSSMVEFTLAGVAAIFILISTFQLAIGMWNYHTLAYAAHEASRYAAVHGYGCTEPGNTCSIYVSDIAHKFKTSAIGVPDSQVIVTLTTDSGAATSCNPLNTCYSGASTTTVWPPSANNDNFVGRKIKVSAIYHFTNAMAFLWPGARKVAFGQVWLPASSTQTILF